jgi:hypothetical protein
MELCNRIQRAGFDFGDLLVQRCYVTRVSNRMRLRFAIAGYSEVLLIKGAVTNITDRLPAVYSQLCDHLFT